MNNSAEISCTFNIAKSIVATTTDYAVQAYAHRTATGNPQLPASMSTFKLESYYLNTLATK